MSLDILELVVHHDLDIRSGGDILAEERWVLFEGFGLDLAYCLSTFRDVSLEFLACLRQVSKHLTLPVSSLHVGKVRALGW